MASNIFGGARAEADKYMLDHAFVQTQNFEALTHTRDFNYVVGRRGTGKSALFLKLIEYIKKNKTGYVFSYAPKEYEQLSLKNKMEQLASSYQMARAITRVAWRISVLVDLTKNIQSHYKYRQFKNTEYLNEFTKNNRGLFEYSSFRRVHEIIKDCSSTSGDVYEIPGKIADKFQVERLTEEVEKLVNEIGSPHYVLFDGLDEGWLPEPISTAILGGLALCASDFRERNSEICVLLFFRDNIFRSLQYFDGDFSRHIEGNTLRLTWDESSLFQLVAERLRASLSLKEVESDGRVWNRFAALELKNLNGFRVCLNYTLFRPRDIIVLLNETYLQVQKNGRQQIIQSDIEVSSKQISKNRLSDLLKEYSSVFPGLELLVNIFLSLKASQTYGEIVSLLDSVIENENYEDIGASDFAIIGTGKEAFFALYSVGFIGLEREGSQLLHFCHDGSPAEIDANNIDQRCCVHPCYWKSLNIQSEVLQEDIRIDLYDDIKPADTSDFADQRTRRIGQIVANLPQMRLGNDDASKFESWVLIAVKMLFSGKVTNPELHPNKDAIQRRDVVGTISTREGFWGAIREDYDVREIIFEVKNFGDMKIDNYRQALSYSGKNYGKFVIIVNRSESEQLDNTERGWVKEFWDQHGVLIFSIPAPFLARCISKLRTKARFDYVEDKLDKRLAQYRRSYLSLRHSKTKTKTKTI
jgi:hypothetical protein